MKNRTIIIICGLLVPLVIAVSFVGRSLLYPRAALRATPLDTAPLDGDASPDDTIVVYYHERRPYYVSTPNQVHGLIADRVNWVFKEAGIPYVWRKTPAKRQLEVIRDDAERACAVGWFKTPAREAYGRFTLPIYIDNPTMALARADNDQIRSGGALAQTLTNRRLRLLRKDGYSFGTYIDERLERHTPREVVTTAENMSMIKMIHTHRADYFFISREEAEDLILCSGLPGKDFKFIQFSDMPAGNKRYLICSRQIDEMTLLRLNRAIKKYLLGTMEATPQTASIIP
jgi:hypothetical protein